MINIRTLKALKNDDGLTLKGGKRIRYKTGYQVADNGIVTKDAREAMNAIKSMSGNAGVWFFNGYYYIDHSFRVATKKEALRIGKENNQISVLRWKDLTCIPCGN